MPQLRVRIPQELKDALEKIAENNDRTLTAEILRRLRESLERDQAISALRQKTS
ncbi:DNA-binding protein [Yersinia pseudotuberculosis]|uniref:Arc family DNA-binding protein n=1 Tax=Yersinia pseudotuberculosis TaxID=633 RepID=UPI0009093043|nr:Arc family DNA-binding protein [Yersinia pseudotuberculosis]AXY36032.1 Arc family DNA-binding protein [Yersinia pseudotuberculosis]AYX13469.1 Arc family DNA-binding protein [Yersinia pseudotuberculosis]PEI15901.1 Arc family DNA-binding protein [Yersinia pseudotuberculosis]PSH19845.1 DNA-binding protein [Yersinia pseudotuberculosis]